MFWRNFLLKTLILLHFFLGGPLFCFLFFFFCSFKAFLSLGEPFLIYAFFSGYALSPKVGGPYVLAQFSAKNTRFFTFFHRRPLVLFLVLLFSLF